MNPVDVAEVSRYPALVADEEDRILAINQAAQMFLGYRRDQVLGWAFHRVVDGRDPFGNRLCADGCALHDMVRRGDPIQAFEIDVRQASGRLVRVGVSVLVVLGPVEPSYRLVYYLIPSRRQSHADDLLEILVKHRTRLEPDHRRRNGSSGRLTRREMDVLRLLAAGETSREVSRALEISLNTMRSHTQNILRKLGVRSKVEAVSLALRQGIV